jgi:hypothetical protein
MNITKIFALIGILMSGIVRADEVDRESKDAKDRPHIVVSATVESIEEVNKEDNGVVLMKAKLKVSAIHRRKELMVELEGKPIIVFYRTGRPQRPRLPKLQKLGEYRMYLRQMKVNGEQVMYLEFEDDVTRIEKPAK